MPEIEFPDVHVQLSGEDGNSFFIIGRVCRALRNADHDPDPFIAAAQTAPSYDALLRLVMRTVRTS